MRIPRDQILKPVLPDNTAINVVGAGGGVGSILLRYLLVFLSSLGKPVRVYAIDGDTYEPRNAERVMFSALGNKATAIVEEYKERLRGSCVSLFAVPEYVTPQNIQRLIRPGAIVFAAVDNHRSRKLLSEHSSTLPEVTLISTGNSGVEIEDGVQERGSYASCQVYIRRRGHEHQPNVAGKDITPPLTFHHPEIKDPKDQAPSDVHCSDLIADASASQLLFSNLLSACLALNSYFLLLCQRPGSSGTGALHYHEIGADFFEGVMVPIYSLRDWHFTPPNAVQEEGRPS